MVSGVLLVGPFRRTNAFGLLNGYLERGARLSHQMATCQYYFVDETEPGKDGRLTLKRVGLDGSERETVYGLDHPIPETGFS